MWDSIKNLIETIAGLSLFVVLIFLFFGIGMLPQFGLLWFIDAAGANGAPMLLPMLALALLGNMYFKAPAFRISIIVISICLLAMAQLRGFYWQPFDRGDGFWTLNRVSSLLLFLCAFFLSQIYRVLAKRFGWSFI